MLRIPLRSLEEVREVGGIFAEAGRDMYRDALGWLIGTVEQIVDLGGDDDA